MERTDWLEEIAIPQLAGGIRTFPPPESESDYLRLEEFIESEFERRKAGREKTKAKAWLRTVCYHAIMVILHSDGEEDLWGRIRNYKRLERGPDRQLEQTVFDVGLVALFASSPDFLSSTSRGRMADAMWYAFRHYIPPALLVGFNHQYPAHLGRDARWRQAIEPALKLWVIQQRCFAEEWGGALDQYRGQYPNEIEEEVDHAQGRRSKDEDREPIEDDDDGSDWDD